MAKKNYSKISSEKAKMENITESLDPIAEAVAAAEPQVEETVVEDTPKVAPAVKTKKGKVYNCVKLNIRKEPKADAEVVGTIDADFTVTILDEVGDFYKIKDGYCMKKFIKTKS